MTILKKYKQGVLSFYKIILCYYLDKTIKKERRKKYMKIIKKVILILVVFFIVSIFTAIAQDMNIPFLPIVPPLIGFYVIYYKIIKK